MTCFGADGIEKISCKRYIASFEAFVQYSEEYGHQLEHLLHVGEQHLKEESSILDIGAGTGFFVKDFLDKSEISALCYTAIEPAREHVEQIKKNFEGLPLEINIQNEIFTPETGLGRKFDLIVMSHSLYWFLPDPEPYVLNALKYLETNGAMVIYLQTPYSACHLLNLLLDNTLPEERTPNHKINSWIIADILDKNHIHYENDSLPGTFKAGTLFENGNKWLLNELVSFFLSVEFESLNSKTQRRAEEALKMLSYKQGNDLKLSLEVGAITVFKDISR